MVKYTRDQLKAMRKQALDDLVKYAGGRTHLSRMLEVPLSTVNSWVDRGLISSNGVDKVAKHEELSERFTKEGLRPDLYL